MISHQTSQDQHRHGLVMTDGDINRLIRLLMLRHAGLDPASTKNLDSGFRDCVIIPQICHSGRASRSKARSGIQEIV